MSHFRCPYCDRDQAVVQSKTDISFSRFFIDENIEGLFGGGFTVISCSNTDCRKTTVDVTITKAVRSQQGYYSDRSIQPMLRQRLLPQGTARVFPKYIPMALLEDYHEACLIRDLSPKASATLVRRCVQGMIRNFCAIKEDTLHKEIVMLRALVAAGQAPPGVTPETVDAIDEVRGIGNIGAHMEKDIDLIIPVEPEEAGALISLVEMLFEEWYVARHRREEKLSLIKQMAVRKKEAKKVLSAPAAPPLALGVIPSES
jgi:hypothetical protein